MPKHGLLDSLRFLSRIINSNLIFGFDKCGQEPLHQSLRSAMSDQRSLKKYFSALILCPVVMIFSYIQENDPFGRFYPFDYF